MLQIIRTLDIWFYALKLSTVLLIVLLAIAVWTVLSAFLSEKHRTLWNAISAILLLAVVSAVAYATLYRTEPIRVLILRPFEIFARAKQNREAYREALMNAILFAPIGLTLPYLFPTRWKCGRKILLTVLCGLLFSLALESAQYCFRLGTTETDDLICNTLGTAVGAFHICAVSAVQKIRKR